MSVVDLEDAHRPGRAVDVIGVAVSRRDLRRRHSALVRVCIGWLVLVSAMTVVAPFLPLADYGEVGGDIRLAPGFRWPEFLGTDHLGRSVLSRIVNGARVSIGVGIGSVLLGMAMGIALGVIAGYFRGKVDAAINVLMDALLAFPPLALLLALASVFEPSLRNLIFALGLLVIPTFGRIARANTLTVASRDFVLAARLLGAGHVRILVREILPTVLLAVSSFAFIVIAALIVAEGSLSFLNLGIPPPQPSWGGMIAAGQPYLGTEPFLVFVPAVMLFVTVFSLNTVGDAVRARFDPRQSALR